MTSENNSVLDFAEERLRFVLENLPDSTDACVEEWHRYILYWSEIVRALKAVSATDSPK